METYGVFMLPTFGLGWRPPTVHGTRLYRKNCPGSTDCASHAADGCTLPCSVSQVVPTVLRSYSGAVHVSRPVLMGRRQCWRPRPARTQAGA